MVQLQPQEIGPEARLSTLSVTPRRRDGVTTFTLSGQLDTYTAHEFRDAFVHYLDSGTGEIVIELAKATLVDSAGINALRTLERLAGSSGCRLRLTCQSPQLAHVLRIVGLALARSGPEPALRTGRGDDLRPAQPDGCEQGPAHRRSSVADTCLDAPGVTSWDGLAMLSTVLLIVLGPLLTLTFAATVFSAFLRRRSQLRRMNQGRTESARRARP